MSYLAIARKYRPATFDEIVGQEHVTRTLRNAIANDRIHHAYLFTGARGVGKTTAARALSKALNCTQGPTATPCGTCTSCVEVASGSSPDLIEIDGASNNSVEDVREIREAVQYAPTAGKYKIYLIDEVHMLSKAAFNALLKTLEEPPAHVVFIFATTEPNRIPDTILSRVQRFDFKRIPVPAVVAHLRGIAKQEKVVVSDNGLRMIARAGEGSMRDAQSLLDQVISYAGAKATDQQVAETLGLIDRSLLYGMLEGLLTGDVVRCLAVIDEVYGYGYELSQFSAELLEALRNATFMSMAKGARAYVDLSDDELDRLTSLTSEVDPQAIGRLFTAMLDTHDRVARSSRPRIVLEMAVVRLATARAEQPVAELVARLEQLERALRRGDGGRGGQGGQSGAGGQGGGPSRGPRGGAGRHMAPRTSTEAAPAKVRATPKRRPEPSPEPARHAEAPRSAEPPTSAKAADNPSVTPADRWERFTFALRKGSSGAKAISRGRHELDGTTLRIALRGGSAMAQGRRAAASTEVLQALQGAFGEGFTLELTEFDPGSGADGEQQALLQTRVLRDPDIQRIMTTLGAALEKVVDLTPGDDS